MCLIGECPNQDFFPAPRFVIEVKKRPLNTDVMPRIICVCLKFSESTAIFLKLAVTLHRLETVWEV